ncbi:MAG: short-chain dehydrogenase [Dehalococcoidia bacterium]|nr:short-chain dehydrogenase [Dehalococcoidia bacterium]
MKRVLITGSSGLIGSEIANLYLEADWEVHGTFFQNTNKINNSNFFPHKLDVSNKKSMDNFNKKNALNFDTLINNAGMNIPNDFDKISLEDWDKIFSVNLKGVFYLTQLLKDRINSNGSIINIASFSGQVGGPRTTHYAASKAGIISLTQNMARFFAEKSICVNAVSPGVIESELANAAKNLPIMKDILLNRLGTAREVAELVFFLSSDKSRYITAQTININGGLYF